jgi:hypothetical protein
LHPSFLYLKRRLCKAKKDEKGMKGKGIHAAAENSF